MQKHTKTLWKISATGGLIVPDNGNPIATICRGFDRDEDLFPNWEENASRIVACVNACEGIPTELLEQGAGFWEKANLHDEERDVVFSDLLRVNARLLEVLKEMVNATSDDFAVTYGFGEQRDAAIGAIAKAEKTTTETSWNKNEKI